MSSFPRGARARAASTSRTGDEGDKPGPPSVGEYVGCGEKGKERLVSVGADSSATAHGPKKERRAAYACGAVGLLKLEGRAGFGGRKGQGVRTRERAPKRHVSKPKENDGTGEVGEYDCDGEYVCGWKRRACQCRGKGDLFKKTKSNRLHGLTGDAGL